jgi:prepilin-type N-terminal cleavage/methylation domain-containing protein
MKPKAGNSGFTLIELMIVVAIISILAAMAIPRFMAISTKNKQAEAKLILKQIYMNQRAYRQAGTGYYLPATSASASNPFAFSVITIEISPTAKYTYSITGTDTSFIATATSGKLDDDPVLDIWQIDNNGKLDCLSDDADLE